MIDSGKWIVPQVGGVPYLSKPPLINWLVAGAFWAMIGTACAGLRQPGGGRTVALAALVAFAVVLPVHLGFNAARLGYSLPAASFRYDLPIWPALAHALAHAVHGASGRVRHAALGVAATAMVLGWVA